MKYILTVGEMLVDVIPTAAVQLGQACYAPYPGGAVANVAVAIARLGGSARFIGGIAEDVFGRLLRQTLTDNGVDAQYVQINKDASTAIALVTLQASGERSFTFFRQGTADMRLEAGHLNREAWNEVAICHVGGVLLASEPARSATFAAMEYTRLAGSLVSLDINVRPALWASSAVIRDVLAQGVEGSDILKLSVEEAEFLVEAPVAAEGILQSNDELSALGNILLQRGPRLIIFTLGAQGALLVTSRYRVRIPASGIQAVDTTGAGDAFMGAVLYRLVQHGCHVPAELDTLEEEDLRALGTFANTVAGLSVTRYGGISSFPFMDEVTAFQQGT